MNSWYMQQLGWISRELCYVMGFPSWLSSERIRLQYRSCKRLGFNPWVRKIPWRRAWQPTPVFLAGESHGQRSLAAYSPECRKESDMTEVT